MKLGICCESDNFELAKQIGFDYAEPSIQPFRAYDEKTLNEIKKKTEDIGFEIDGFKNFFSGDISLYDNSLEFLVSYAEINFEVSRLFNCDYNVVGSGKSRSIPEGMERSKAEHIFMNVINAIAEKGKEYGVKLYIEPLNYGETNYINTLKDGIEFKRRLNNDNVGCLIDFFHFFKNKEDLSELDMLNPGELTHVHLARPNDDRDAPIKEDAPVIKQWADKLKEIGYSGRVSLECVWRKGLNNSGKEALEQLQLFK